MRRELLMSYESYCKGLELVEGTREPTCQADVALARKTLASLHAATIGAGSNTWRKAIDRYKAARHRVATFPTFKGNA